MSTFHDIVKLALGLSEHERARLAKTLIESLLSTKSVDDQASHVIEHTNVRSSMLRSIRYDRHGQFLEVIFRTGDAYRYENVPMDEYERLMDADSKGRYMQEHIIGNYSYQQLKS